jgi:hypothetical protein
LSALPTHPAQGFPTAAPAPLPFPERDPSRVESYEPWILAPWPLKSAFDDGCGCVVDPADRAFASFAAADAVARPCALWLRWSPSDAPAAQAGPPIAEPAIIRTPAAVTSPSGPRRLRAVNVPPLLWASLRCDTAGSPVPLSHDEAASPLSPGSCPRERRSRLSRLWIGGVRRSTARGQVAGVVGLRAPVGDSHRSFRPRARIV